MTTLDRLLDLLPPPYGIADDSVLAGMMGVFAVEFEAVQEDIERLRRTHWINQAYRFEDARKLGDLCGIAPLPGETLDSFRARLVPLIKAQLGGALGADDIRTFLETYLRNAEKALESILVAGLQGADSGAGFDVAAKRPGFRPLALTEFPLRDKRSTALATRGGLVPVLFRWTETNGGLDPTVPILRISGLAGRKTVVPLIANLTTGDMILFADRLPAGTELEIAPDPAGDGRAARAMLDGADATAKLRSLSGFELGKPFGPADFDAAPRLPPLPRGASEWVYLSVGLYDVRGLDHMFFAHADGELREGRFDETRFDHALFPSGPVARLDMQWREHEGAAFDVEVPRTIVVEPAGAPDGQRPHQLVADALERSIAMLHAAGVRATLRFAPFTEQQRQRVRHNLPWIRLEPETGPSGRNDRFDFGFQFGETGLGQARFE